MSSTTRSARRAYARRVMERAGIPHPCRKNQNYENTSFFSRHWREAWKKVKGGRKRGRLARRRAAD